MQEENLILFDWFSFTSPIFTPFSMIEFLGLKNCEFRQSNGHRTYLYKLSYGEIHICYGSSVNEGVWVEMSGQGCRQFEEYSKITFIDLLQAIIDNPNDFHISRIDVAFDCYDKKVLDIAKLKRETDNLNFISKFRNVNVMYEVHTKYYTVYYGTKSSDMFMRCYDKKGERERDDIAYWVRWEIVLKNDNALEFSRKLIEDGESIGSLFFGVVNNYVRYIVPDESQTNTSRLKTAKWWLRFVDTVNMISVYSSKNTVYNLYKCEKYGYTQAGNAIAALIDIKGVDSFIKELNERKPKRTMKYQSLIDVNGLSNDNIQVYMKERGL